MTYLLPNTAILITVYLKTYDATKSYEVTQNLRKFSAIPKLILKIEFCYLRNLQIVLYCVKKLFLLMSILT